MKKFENCRKSILPAFVLLFTLTAAFADKSRFYQDGKVIYVEIKKVGLFEPKFENMICEELHNSAY